MDEQIREELIGLARLISRLAGVLFHASRDSGHREIAREVEYAAIDVRHRLSRDFATD